MTADDVASAASADWTPGDVARAFADLGRTLGTVRTVDETLERLTEASVRLIPGAEDAAVSLGRSHGREPFRTVAATSDLPLRVDKIQYDLERGPCVDAILDQTVFRTGDLRSDPRWPDFGQRAADDTGVLSMLSVRIFLGDDDLIAGMNYYASKPQAFDDTSEALGVLAATHGALALTAARQHERAANLERALQSNRDIGVAMGVLMSNHKITKQQAFDLLRVASQHTHRKLRDVAEEVGETGALDLPTANAAAASSPDGH